MIYILVIYKPRHLSPIDVFLCLYYSASTFDPWSLFPRNIPYPPISQPNQFIRLIHTIIYIKPHGFNLTPSALPPALKYLKEKKLKSQMPWFDFFIIFWYNISEESRCICMEVWWVRTDEVLFFCIFLRCGTADCHKYLTWLMLKCHFARSFLALFFLAVHLEEMWICVYRYIERCAYLR